jgi:hypothetical protein
VEPETENDAAGAELFATLSRFHFDCSGGSSDSDKELFK